MSTSLEYLYVQEKQRQGSHARRYVVTGACDKAITVLRDLEDLARLTLHDEVLADRARECYECITERILNGRKGEGLSRAQMEDVVWHFEWLVEFGAGRGSDTEGAGSPDIPRPTSRAANSQSEAE